MEIGFLIGPSSDVMRAFGAGWPWAWLRLPVAALLVLAASGVAEAQAQERDPREQEAKKACLSGGTDRGIELLAELFAETNDSTYIYNQARCFQQGGKPKEALISFQEYQRKARDIPAEEKAEVQASIAEMEEQLRPKPSPAPDLSARPPAESAMISTPGTTIEEARPVYKRWWFWTGISAVVAAGVTTAIVVAMSGAPDGYRGDLSPGRIAVPSE